MIEKSVRMTSFMTNYPTPVITEYYTVVMGNTNVMKSTTVDSFIFVGTNFRGLKKTCIFMDI